MFMSRDPQKYFDERKRATGNEVQGTMGLWRILPAKVNVDAANLKTNLSIVS